MGLLAVTGMRTGAAIDLDRVDFDPTGGWLVVRDSKRGASRQLALSDSTVAALQPRSTRCRPRPHDLRHSFAVATLVEWYRAGVDVAAHLPALSTYQGHADPTNPYWYLSPAPELMRLAT